MTSVREQIAEINEDAMLLEERYDRALVGVAARCTLGPVAVYDREKLIDLLLEEGGMSYEEAEEYFEYNIAGAYVGEYTPVYFTRLDETTE